MKCKNCGDELVRVWVHKRADNDNTASHFDNPRPKHTGNYMKRWCDCPKAAPKEQESRENQQQSFPKRKDAHFSSKGKIEGSSKEV